MIDAHHLMIVFLQNPVWNRKLVILKAKLAIRSVRTVLNKMKRLKLQNESINDFTERNVSSMVPRACSVKLLETSKNDENRIQNSKIWSLGNTKYVKVKPYVLKKHK